MDALKMARVVVCDPPTSYDSAGLLPLAREVISMHEQNAALRARIALLERVREAAEAVRASKAPRWDDTPAEVVMSAPFDAMVAALDAAKEAGDG